MREERGTVPSDAELDRLGSDSRSVIRVELSSILASPAFRNSKRSKDFLTYVVERTLAGEGDALKERTIGIEVFGKDATYDANEDPVVRVRAGDIRKRLGVYYAALDNVPDLIIELAAGSYVPRFRFLKDGLLKERSAGGTLAPVVPKVHLPEAFPCQSAPEDEIFAPKARRRKGWWIFFAIACPSLLLFAAVSLWQVRHANPVFEKFWEPVLKNPSPIIIGAAYTPVFLHSVNGNPPKDVYTQVNNGYLGGGDLVAASQIAGMLGARKHPFVTRIGDSTSFQDLSTAPSVLIGYSMHFWNPLTKDFRYVIREENGVILDRGKPTGWGPHNLTPDLHVDDDYAIIVRTFHPQTHEMMILVGGSEQYGTQAAAELITNPALLADAMKNAPPNWQNGNLQLILHTKIVNNAPAVPEIVASYYW